MIFEGFQVALDPSLEPRLNNLKTLEHHDCIVQRGLREAINQTPGRISWNPRTSRLYSIEGFKGSHQWNSLSPSRPPPPRIPQGGLQLCHCSDPRQSQLLQSNANQAVDSNCTGECLLLPPEEDNNSITIGDTTPIKQWTVIARGNVYCYHRRKTTIVLR